MGKVYATQQLVDALVVAIIGVPAKCGLFRRTRLAIRLGWRTLRSPELEHRRVIRLAPDMLPQNHFSLSPTILELGAEICSNGRQTITIRRLRRLNYAFLVFAGNMITTWRLSGELTMAVSWCRKVTQLVPGCLVCFHSLLLLCVCYLAHKQSSLEH